MPTIFPIAAPTTFGASTFSIDLIPVVAVSESPYTNSQQAQAHQGETWEIQVGLELLNRDQFEEYSSFIHLLRGRAGSFTMAIPGSEKPRGSAGGTPVVAGAGQTGEDLNTSGWTPSQTGILKAGDYIQLGTGLTTRLHKVLIDVNSDAGGLATLTLAPKVVTAPADLATIIVNDAKGLFRLKSNSNPVNITPPNQFTVSFAAREVR